MALWNRSHKRVVGSTLAGAIGRRNQRDGDLAECGRGELLPAEKDKSRSFISVHNVGDENPRPTRYDDLHRYQRAPSGILVLPGGGRKLMPDQGPLGRE